MEAEFYQAGLSNQFSHIRICEFSHVICLALVLVSFLDAPGITAWTHRSQSDTHRDHGQGAIASSWHFPRGIIRYHKLCAKNCEVNKSPIRFRYFEFVRYLRSLEPTKTPHSMEVRPAHISWKLGEQFQKDCTTKSFESFPRQLPNILKPRHPSWGHTIRCVDWNWRWHWQPGTLPWHLRAWQSKFHILVNDVALELGGRVLYIHVRTNPYCTLIISFVFEYVFRVDACAMAGAFGSRASMNDLAGRHWPAWAPRPCNAVLPQEAILRVRAWWESGCVPSKARCLSHSFFIVSSIFLNFRFNLSTKRRLSVAPSWSSSGPMTSSLGLSVWLLCQTLHRPMKSTNHRKWKDENMKTEMSLFCSLLYMYIYIYPGTTTLIFMGYTSYNWYFRSFMVLGSKGT